MGENTLRVLVSEYEIKGVARLVVDPLWAKSITRVSPLSCDQPLFNYLNCFTESKNIINKLIYKKEAGNSILNKQRKTAAIVFSATNRCHSATIAF